MSRLRITVVSLLALTGILASLPSGASAAKVANPGPFTANVVDGSIRIKQQTFTFDENSGIQFNGTVTSAGVIAVPPGGVIFPSFPLQSGGFNLTVSIRPADTSGSLQPISGTIDPQTGVASLRLRVWIKIDGVPFGGGCRIGSASAPIDVNALITGTMPALGNNPAVTGIPYNLSNGTLKVVNNNFSVPSSSDCGLAAGTVNDSLGLPSAAGNNEAQFTLDTEPILQRAIVPSFTATPSSGEAPLNVNFNASGTFSSRPVQNYRWDFDNNGTFEQTTTSPTTSFVYQNPGSYTARLRVTDIDGDFADTTRPISVSVSPPDLSIDKSHSGPFRVGSQATYTIAIDGQRGPTTGPVTVTDTLPAGLTFVSATGTGWNCGNSGQDVTCVRNAALTYQENPPNITITVGVTEAALPSVTNTASVATTGDADSSDNSDSDPTTITATDLTIDKSHQGQFGNFYSGQNDTYTLQVSNIGTAPTVGTTTVTDTLPEGLTYAGAAGDGWTCSANGQDVTCIRSASIPAETDAPPITLTVTPSVGLIPGGSKTVTNTATVTTADDIDESNNSDSDETLILDSPDLAIDKESSTETFTAATQGSYTITVQNRGPRPALGATVSDTLPDGLTFVSGTGTGWTCQAVAQDVTCLYPDTLNTGETAPPITLTVDVGLAAIPEVTNEATVSTPGDANPSNDTDSETTEVRQIDLTIDKSAVGVFRVDSNGTWLITVSNIGNSATATETTVTDTLPTGATFVSATGEGWDCANAGQNVTCTFDGNVPGAGGSAPPISLVVALDNASVPEITNTATVATNDDLVPDNNSDSVTTPVIEQDVAIDKTHTGTFTIGAQRTYILSVDNVGTRPTTGTTTVTDALPAGLTFVSASGSGWSCSAVGQDVTCDRAASIPALSAAPDISLQVAVGPGVGPSVSNTAMVSTPGDRNALNDSDTDQAAISSPDLTIDKSHAGSFTAGGTGTYTLTVSNSGTLATNAKTVVTDTLPAGLGYISATGTGWSCSASGQDVTCERTAPIAATASAPAITLKVSVSGSAPSTVTNTASVSLDSEPNTTNNSDSDETTVNRTDAAIDFSGPADIDVGQDATYTIAVTNPGSAATSADVNVHASFETGVQPVEATGTGWDCNVTGQDVDCTHTGALAAGGGEAEDISVRNHVTNDADDLVEHTATVSTSGDFSSGNDSDTVESDVHRNPNLTLAISSVDAGGYRVGAPGAYRLTVRNAGGIATDDPTSVTLDLPTGFTTPGDFTGSGDWNCNLAGQIVTCSTSEGIDPETNNTIEVPVEVSNAAPASATANASVNNTDDPVGADNDASTTDPVTRIDIAVTEDPGPSFAEGKKGTFEFNVTNVGSAATVAQTTLTDTLPAGFTYDTASGPGWTCGASKQTVTCTHAGPISAGGSAGTVTLKVDVSEGSAAIVQNAVQVSTLDDVDTSNNSDSEFLLVTQKQPPPPPPDPVEKPVKIKTGKAVASRDGFLTIFLYCPKSATARCEGKLRLRSAGKVRLSENGSRKRQIAMGEGTYAIAAGRRYPVTMQLTEAAKKALEVASVRARAVARPTDTEVAPTKRAVRVRARRAGFS